MPFIKITPTNKAPIEKYMNLVATGIELSITLKTTRSSGINKRLLKIKMIPMPKRICLNHGNFAILPAPEIPYKPNNARIRPIITLTTINVLGFLAKDSGAPKYRLKDGENPMAI